MNFRTFSEAKTNAHYFLNISVCGKKGVNNDTKLYDVGFKVEGKKIIVYRVCRNKLKMMTLYATAEINHYAGLEAGIKCGNGLKDFVKGDFFGKLKMDNAYTKATQEKYFKTLLGDKIGSRYIYIKNDPNCQPKRQKLSRKHIYNIS